MALLIPSISACDVKSLLSSTVWFHQYWATPAALLSFAFDLIGGGAITRITIVIKCIADISPPEKLSVLQNTPYDYTKVVPSASTLILMLALPEQIGITTSAAFIF